MERHLNNILPEEFQATINLEAVRSWTAQDVVRWLDTKQMGKYAANFIEHEIIGDVLLDITHASLKAMKIPTVGDRIRLYVLIDNLRRDIRQNILSFDELPLSAHKKSSAELDSLNDSLEYLYGSTPNINGLRTSIMSMDFVKQYCIKVIGEKNETRIVNVKDIKDPKLVMDKILAKFNIVEDPEKFSVFVSISDSARILSESELFDICRDPSRPEREKLFLRKKHTPFSFARAKETNGAPTIRQKLGQDEPQLPSVKSASKLNKFFGERPPSELISSNLLEFFPKDGVMNMERRKSKRARKVQSMLADLTHSSNQLFTNHPLSSRLNNSADSISDSPDDINEHSNLSAIVGALNTSENPPTTDDTLPDSANTMRPRADRTISVMKRSKDRRQSLSTSNSISQLNVANTSPPTSPNAPVGSENAPSRWVKGVLIGQGSFGAVYLGLNYFTGELMAVKQVELPPDSNDQASAKDRRGVMVQALEHEISFLKDLHHPHIVQYLGSTVDENFFNIFLEYIPGGSISANLKTWGAFPEPVIKSYLRQVIEGLEYLHDKDIIHRDIKAANILVDNHAHVKISDFGISKRVSSEEMLTMSSSPISDMTGADNEAKSAPNAPSSVKVSLEGSVYWMSPEIVKHMMYTRKSDIWALGCLVIEMFTANHPWPNATQVEVLFKLGSEKRPDLPEGLSEHAYDLLNKTFDLNYTARPAATDLLKHPFIVAPAVE